MKNKGVKEILEGYSPILSPAGQQLREKLTEGNSSLSRNYEGMMPSQIVEALVSESPEPIFISSREWESKNNQGFRSEFTRGCLNKCAFCITNMPLKPKGQVPYPILVQNLLGYLTNKDSQKFTEPGFHTNFGDIGPYQDDVCDANAADAIRFFQDNSQRIGLERKFELGIQTAGRPVSQGKYQELSDRMESIKLDRNLFGRVGVSFHLFRPDMIDTISNYLERQDNESLGKVNDLLEQYAQMYTGMLSCWNGPVEVHKLKVAQKDLKIPLLRTLDRLQNQLWEDVSAWAKHPIHLDEEDINWGSNVGKINYIRYSQETKTKDDLNYVPSWQRN